MSAKVLKIWKIGFTCGEISLTSFSKLWLDTHNSVLAVQASIFRKFHKTTRVYTLYLRNGVKYGKSSNKWQFTNPCRAHFFSRAAVVKIPRHMFTSSPLVSLKKAKVLLSLSWSSLAWLSFAWLGFVVGQAGLYQGIAMFLVAYFIICMTVLSVCAISTNGALDAGGAYCILFIYTVVLLLVQPSFGLIHWTCC